MIYHTVFMELRPAGSSAAMDMALADSKYTLGLGSEMHKEQMIEDFLEKGGNLVVSPDDLEYYEKPENTK